MNALSDSVFLKVRPSRFMRKSCMVSHVSEVFVGLKAPGLLPSSEFLLQLFSNSSVIGYLMCCMPSC